jgi:hypothetical protein
MADQMELLMGKLDQLIGQRQQAQAPVMAAAPVMNGFAQPAPVAAAAMQPMFAQAAAYGQQPQPTGISVPINVTLPDGSELTLQVHYGPEHAANPQAFLQMVVALYGQNLKTYRPRWQGGFGHGGYGGAGYGGGFNGRGGRRY